MAPAERDLTWDAMCEFADRVNRSGRAQELEVIALRRRQWLVIVTEGLWVGDKWTDVLEPVRRRVAFSDRWSDIQSVEDAASKIGTFLDSRPDLGESHGG
jgi:hypothetical protein